MSIKYIIAVIKPHMLEEEGPPSLGIGTFVVLKLEGLDLNLHGEVVP